MFHHLASLLSNYGCCIHIFSNLRGKFIYKFEALQKIGSNHFPLIFTAEKINFKNNFPFRFQKIWMQHPQFESKLAEWWNIDVEGTALFKVATKLRNVKKEVKIWNKRCFGNIF